MTAQPSPPPLQPVPSRPAPSSGLALGLALAALAVSLCVGAFVAVQVFFGSPMGHVGWFAYAPSSTELEMGEPMPMLAEERVAVDPSGGVSGEALVAALSGSLDPDRGRLRCQDVRQVVADATSVCTHEGLPAEKIVVLFLDGSGRFTWTPVQVDAGN